MPFPVTLKALTGRPHRTQGLDHDPSMLAAATLRAANKPGRTRLRPRTLAFAIVAFVFIHGEASGFTQSGVGIVIANGIPMGHEWVTRLGALELLGGDPIMRPDPEDPRRNWDLGLAKNIDLSSPAAQRELGRIRAQRYRDQRYQSTYKVVYDAIVGERWVDLGGFNVTTSKVGKYSCFDAVAQEPAEVQYDHFMRRYDDRGADGGVRAATESRKRFIKYFVEAAMAPPTLMKVWDGGGYSARTEVDRNYFLLGRAAHLLQDSFSSEHTVRLGDDNYERVRQVKSYLCAAGSEQHTHAMRRVLDYTSGDVIWRAGTQLSPTWAGYKPSNMKSLALVATEASKDLWAAFIRTMGVPHAMREQTAWAEATEVANNWLYINEAEALAWYGAEANRDDTYVLAAGQGGPGQTVAACMRGLDVPSGSQMEKVQELEETQRICLYNVVSEAGYSDLFDPSLHIPFNWRWRDRSKWKMPPDGWQIPSRPANTGIRVKIRSARNNLYMTAPDGTGNDKWIYVRAGHDPLEFILVGNRNDGFYRLTNASLFLSYRGLTGAVKLYHTPDEASYQLLPAGGGHAIKNLHWNQYMWLSGESPYITKAGDPKKLNAQWVIEGLPPL